MKFKRKFCILFAGAIGSSKTPIANYLSNRLNLLVHNNDSVRTEVVEDLGHLDEGEYFKRRDERILFLLNSEISFILDASIDRQWEIHKKKLDKFKYDYFVISLDFSKNLLKQIYKQKRYKDFESLDRTLKDHDLFLKENSRFIGVNLSDGDFSKRLNICLNAVKEWMQNIQDNRKNLKTHFF